MDVLEAVENETLESHSMDVLYTMEILEIEQSEVTASSPIKTTKKQAILLENKPKMPHIAACCQVQKESP
jgi:hypothetical protein